MRLRSSRRNQIGERIGLELRALYGEALCEPLPDRFCELLGRLEQVTTAATASSPTPGKARRSHRPAVPIERRGDCRRGNAAQKSIVWSRESKPFHVPLFFWRPRSRREGSLMAQTALYHQAFLGDDSYAGENESDRALVQLSLNQVSCAPESSSPGFRKG